MATTDTRVCRVCGRDRALEAFGWSHRERGLRKTLCTDCATRRRRQLAALNVEPVVVGATERDRAGMAAHLRAVSEVLLEKAMTLDRLANSAVGTDANLLSVAVAALAEVESVPTLLNVRGLMEAAVRGERMRAQRASYLPPGVEP